MTVMIKRITKIKNIGKFLDCQPGGCSFGSNTIIFGNNTEGKSTITSIFKSLSEGNSDYIVGRKSFGSSTNQEVELVFDNNGTNEVYRFPSTQWSNRNKKFAIFDTNYIHDNVFTGDEITFENQKKLNEIIIGDEGRRIKLEIDTLQSQLDELSRNKREKTAELSRLLNSKNLPNVTVDDFVAIENVENLDSQLDQLKERIHLLKSKQKVIETFEQTLQTLNNYRFNKTKEILSKQIEVNPERVAKHIENTWNNVDASKSFLSTGLDLMKVDMKLCVFCGQEIKEESAINLLDEYNKIFKGAYTELNSDVQDTLTKYNRLSLKSILQDIQKKFLELKIQTNLNDEKILEIEALKEAFGSEIETKSKDLNYEVNFEQLNNLQKEITELIEHFTILQSQSVISDNVNLQQIENQLKDLEIVKFRYEPEGVELSNEVNSIIQRSNSTRQTRETKREELTNYSRNTFAIHKDSINTFLIAMSADFRIEEFKPITRLVGQRERVFSLQFYDNHTVHIDEATDTLPNFKNTLSESDKRLLAFAFFLSSLANDQELNNRIIVLDDPFSSFDENRKRKTTHLISDIKCKYQEDGQETIKIPLQKIILTHEKNFFKELTSLLSENVTTLKIVPDGNQGNLKKSNIEHCNIQEFSEDEIYKHLRELKVLKENNTLIDDFSGFALKCRKVLEAIFKRKYYIELKEAIDLNKSIRTFTDKLNELQINSFHTQDKYNSFIRLCNDLNIELHENATSNTGENARTVLDDFFDAIKQI